MPEMRHPKLPPDQTITVADEAVPQHELQGWQVVKPTSEKPAEPVNPKE